MPMAVVAVCTVKKENKHVIYNVVQREDNATVQEDSENRIGRKLRDIGSLRRPCVGGTV